MFILNGRLFADRVGKPTSRNLSVVDYVLSSANLMCKIKDFEVLDFCSLFSDIHSPLFLELNCEKVSLEETKSFSTNDTEHIGKWKHEKILEFKGNINTDEVDELFSRLLEKSENLDVVDQNCINVIVDDVTNILLKPAKKTFGVHVNMSKYENNNNNNKDWFNKDCIKSRQAYRKSLRLFKHYGSNVFKQRLRNSEKHYKKTMSDSIRLFNFDFRQKMKKLRTKNPREFWKLLNVKKKTVNNEIDLQSLFHFFKDMNENKDYEAKSEPNFDINHEESNDFLNKSLLLRSRMCVFS
ncbi:unnamed protein product [Mytilus coruscus]|uniref:Uncharacterized protein n=1 Tax=Mytilus coruscus TaxID=42192 RepID=A0A6J8DMD2_MYTCO|nr:unnamed protein product [Mytilus coruscus]